MLFAASSPSNASLYSGAHAVAGDASDGLQDHVPSESDIARFQTHFNELERHLATRLTNLDTGPGFRSSPRSKLSLLSLTQFNELSTDFYDELFRRRQVAEGARVPFLPARADFPPKRNETRGYLAALPATRFDVLSSDIHFELKSRFPAFTLPHLDNRQRLLERRLVAYVASPINMAPDFRSSPRSKLSRLQIVQWNELYTDVDDELSRRRQALLKGARVPFLPVRADFPPKRNQTRQKLATLSALDFDDLCGDVHFELRRRFLESTTDVDLTAQVSELEEEDFIWVSSQMLTYKRLFTFVYSSAGSRIRRVLNAHRNTASASNITSAIVNSCDSYTELMKLAADVGQSENPALRDAIREDTECLAADIRTILNSGPERAAVLRLEGISAQKFTDAIQDTLERGFLLDKDGSSRARRMIIKLSEVANKLPSWLFISGVTGREEFPMFGGGFGDIYRASYAGKIVALKHLRVFQRGEEQRRTQLQFYKEAVVWQHLQHPAILPFIGIDRETFPGSPCLVSPWMVNGTVLKYLDTHGRANVDKLLFEISQGLEYLYSKNIVHGDLRGANILITPEWSACLADFGLTCFSDVTNATSTSHGRPGSIRWMAPELIAPERFGVRFLRTPATDVYAFGCVCVELYTGHAPFTGLTEAAAILKVIEGARPEQPTGMAVSLWFIANECWAQDSILRPNAESLVKRLSTKYSAP